MFKEIVTICLMSVCNVRVNSKNTVILFQIIIFNMRKLTTSFERKYQSICTCDYAAFIVFTVARAMLWDGSNTIAGSLRRYYSSTTVPFSCLSLLG